MTNSSPWILASASPRRAEILEMLGIAFDVQPAHIDESVLPGEVPGEHVERLARGKAAAISPLHPGRVVLAGDTVVTIEGEILGKPDDEDAAVRMLLRLAGRSHEVFSALAVAAGTRSAGTLHSGVRSTRVHFRSFGEGTARAYVETGEPMDKAGAYGIQGLGAVLVEGIEGDYTGVVGLPVPLLLELSAAIGFAYRFPK
ncbi:MAG: septum formation protein Maf [Gemmatimonadales bacterium]|nr:MAG: septum formation protein Maf [Gemmatimonadales bacterium]